MKKLAILLLAVFSMMIVSCKQSAPDQIIKLADQAESKGESWSQEKWEEVTTQFSDLLDEYKANEDSYGAFKQLSVWAAVIKFCGAAEKYVVAPELKSKLQNLSGESGDDDSEGEEGEEVLSGLDQAITETADNIADALSSLF